MLTQPITAPIIAEYGSGELKAMLTGAALTAQAHPMLTAVLAQNTATTSAQTMPVFMMALLIPRAATALRQPPQSALMGDRKSVV